MRKLAIVIPFVMWILSATLALAQGVKYQELTDKNTLGKQGVIVIAMNSLFTPPASWSGKVVRVTNGRMTDKSHEEVVRANISEGIVWVWRGRDQMIPNNGIARQERLEENKIEWVVVDDKTQFGSIGYPQLIEFNLSPQGQATLTPTLTSAPQPTLTPPAVEVKGFLERVGGSPAPTGQVVAVPLNWRPEPYPEPPSGITLPWLLFWPLLIFGIIGAIGTFLIAKDRYELWKMRREDPWRY